MGFCNVQQSYKASTAGAVSIAPYYGVSANPIASESLVLSLAGRGPTPGAILTDFTITQPPGAGLYGYFAYPSEYGTAKFFDKDSSFYGGWDGANNDPFNVYGPVEILVSGTPFYVYRTDYPDLGTTRWKAEPDA